MEVHAEAKAIYQQYLARSAVLERNRRFADQVRQATSAKGQTPVEPLATMGRNGGPLLCDVCGKPMILEGGKYNNVHADEAWRRNPQQGWVSWIAGGMVVRIESNGSLRVFHGYPGRSGCVIAADKADDSARNAFRKPADVTAKLDALSAYLKADLPDQATDTVLTDIYRVMFIYDPGLGINAVD